MSAPVLIRYTRNIAAKDGRRAFIKGEEGVVASVATAERDHPDATIVGYYGENGQITEIEKSKATEKVAEKPNKDS